MEREAVKGPSGRARKSRLVNRVDERVGCLLFFFKEDGRSNGTHHLVCLVLVASGSPRLASIVAAKVSRFSYFNGAHRKHSLEKNLREFFLLENP